MIYLSRSTDTPGSPSDEAVRVARTASGWREVLDISDTSVGLAPQATSAVHQGTLSDLRVWNEWVYVDQQTSDPLQDARDRWQRTYGRVWRYWITTPDDLLAGVRRFVAAAEAGGVPDDWGERQANDGSRLFTVCSFRLTMDGARSLGAEQEALMALADLPDGVHFFQRVAEIPGFRGVEKKSKQPKELPTPTSFAPQALFQTNHPGAAGERGGRWTEQDVLDTTGLTLI